MNRFILVLLLCLLPLSAASGHTLLVVFAHPDDETAIGPLLAKYAAEGQDVYIAFATSGHDGNGNTELPKGDRLAREREGEARRSCKALGIHEPIFLRFVDGTTSIRKNTMAMAPRIREVINKVKPEVIITFGGDGSSGHPDNRVAGNVTTEVFQQRGLLEHHPRKLYYTLKPESEFIDGPPAFSSSSRPFRTVSDTFVTTVIDGHDYLDQAYQSIRCHKTQFNEEAMRNLYELTSKNLAGKVYLRLALTDLPFPTKKETNIFEGLH